MNPNGSYLKYVRDAIRDFTYVNMFAVKLLALREKNTIATFFDHITHSVSLTLPLPSPILPVEANGILEAIQKQPRRDEEGRRQEVSTDHLPFFALQEHRHRWTTFWWQRKQPTQIDQQHGISRPPSPRKVRVWHLLK